MIITILYKVGLNISPNADEAIMPGDVLIVIGSNTNLANLEKKVDWGYEYEWNDNEFIKYHDKRNKVAL